MNLLKIKNVTLDSSNIFDFLNVWPLSPGGFITFLVAVAHGVPPTFSDLSKFHDS